METARYVGGAALGGLIAALGGTELAMVVNAATFCVVALAALRLRARREPQPAGDTPDRARDGVVYLFRDRTLALVLSVVFVSLLFMTASATAEVFFLRRRSGSATSSTGLCSPPGRWGWSRAPWSWRGASPRPRWASAC